MLRHWIPIWVIPVVILFAIGTVWLRLSIVGTTYSIDQVEKTIRNLQQEREQLKLVVTGLRSPRRLEALAVSKFGLTQPKAEQVVHLK
jgi:cell division protein FtsL